MYIWYKKHIERVNRDRQKIHKCRQSTILICVAPNSNLPMIHTDLAVNPFLASLHKYNCWWRCWCVPGVFTCVRWNESVWVPSRKLAALRYFAHTKVSRARQYVAGLRITPTVRRIFTQSAAGFRSSRTSRKLQPKNHPAEHNAHAIALAQSVCATRVLSAHRPPVWSRNSNTASHVACNSLCFCLLLSVCVCVCSGLVVGYNLIRCVALWNHRAAQNIVVAWVFRARCARFLPPECFESCAHAQFRRSTLDLIAVYTLYALELRTSWCLRLINCGDWLVVCRLMCELFCVECDRVGTKCLCVCSNRKLRLEAIA